jgi:class 3 adenylate cyclase/tetratricopeptide (TPR) repeat protein
MSRGEIEGRFADELCVARPKAPSFLGRIAVSQSNSHSAASSTPQLASVCGRCKHPRRESDRFCSQCGVRFDDTVAERKTVTLLFADLCGSTALVAQADPEDAQLLLDLVLKTMADAVETYGGSVRRLQGDGIVAVFGAPIAQEDHALRACLAALEVLRRMQDPGQAERMLNAQVRIGVHTGEVVVGAINDLLASHQRLDGAAIHLAARLEQLAAPGQVLISATTARLLDGALPLRPMGSHAVRGFERPVDLFELDPDSASVGILNPSTRRPRSPLLGRQELLQTLQGVATRVAGGQLSLLGLRGDAGVGKSRLVAQFGANVRSMGFRVCAMAARSYTRHVPYSALGDLMRALMGLTEEVDPRRAREAAREEVAQWGVAGRPHVPAALDLLGIEAPDPAWLALTPKQRRAQFGQALMWLATEHLQRGPLMILIEDIFLADRDSVETFEGMAHQLEGLPVLLCFTYRRDFVHRWAEALWFEEVWVQPLTPSDMLQLARALLGHDPSLDILLPTLLERAGGNPFYLEQMSLNLVDTGALDGEPGHFRYTSRSADQSVPASIAAVIGARVDRLPPAAKSILEALAILNEVSSADMLAPMLRCSESTVTAQLALCCNASLLQSAVSGEVVARCSETAPASAPVKFQHALVQEVVVAALTRPRRRQLHQAAYQAMHEQLGEQVNEQAAVLAHHAHSGGLWTEAARFSHLAMVRSVARSANRDALRILETGLDATSRIEDAKTRLTFELLLRTESVGALWPLGHFDAMFAHLERASAITAELEEPKRQTTVALQQAVLHWARGNPALGMEAAQTARASAQKAGSQRALMSAALVELMLLHGEGRYTELVERADQIERLFAVELGAGRPLPGWATLPATNHKVFLADALSRLGDEAAAQQVCDKAYEELRHREHPFSRALLDFSQTSLWLRQGQHERAATRLRESLAACRHHDLNTMTPCIVGLLADALGQMEQVAEAEMLVHRALEGRAHQIAGLYSEFFLHYGLGRALAAAGRSAEAQEQLSAAQDYAARYQQWGHEADAQLALGELAWQRGDAVAAQTHWDAAIRNASQCGMRRVEQHARDLKAALPPSERA